MATTDYIVNSEIPGTIRFMERGGTFGELDCKDVRPFDNRMGEDKKEFAFPLLQSKMLRVSDILLLLSIQKDPEIRADFLKSALR